MKREIIRSQRLKTLIHCQLYGPAGAPDGQLALRTKITSNLDLSDSKYKHFSREGKPNGRQTKITQVFFPGFRIMNTTAATQIMIPTVIFIERGSLNSTVPIRMAVKGSKTPRTEVFVGPI